jgi:colanic acid biosynthesis glycosyl transferase WcaI
MKIVLLADRYWPEARAAAYLCSELAVGLARQGHSVTVLTRSPTRFVPNAIAPPEGSIYEGHELGIRVHRFRGLSGDSIAIRALDHLLLAFKCCIVLFGLSREERVFVMSPPLAITLGVVVRSVFRFGAGYVLNLHDLYPRAAIELGVLRNRLLISALKAYERLLYSRASVILAAAPSSVKILREEFNLPEERVRLLHNFVRMDVVGDRPRLNAVRRRLGLEGKFVVLYAGLMGLAQDLEVVIKCARENSAIGDWVFVLFGDGPMRQQWVKSSAELPNVIFQDPVSTSEYLDVVASSDVCIVPLVAEFKAPAIPGKVSSIMSCGRPIVALVPPGNDTREVIEGARCGIVLQSGDVIGLGSALRTIWQDPDLWVEMSENARRYAAERFSVENAVRTCEEALRS